MYRKEGREYVTKTYVRLQVRPFLNMQNKVRKNSVSEVKIDHLKHKLVVIVYIICTYTEDITVDIQKLFHSTTQSAFNSVCPVGSG